MRILNTKVLLLALLTIVLQVSVSLAAETNTTPLKINALKAVCNDNGFVATCFGTKELRKYNNDFSTLEKSWSFEQNPTGVIATPESYYVTTFTSFGELHKIDIASGEVVGTLKLESGSIAPILSKDQKTLYVCNQFQNTVSKVDLESFKVVGSTPVLREPKGGVITLDGKFLYISNFLTNERADVDVVCSSVSVIDLESFTAVKHIPLANGSNALRGITISKDGKNIFISHNLGRFQVPTNQLQQGWMNTSAVSIIDVASQEYIGAVLLDDPEQGAAGIEQMMITDDKMVVIHSGVHEVSIVDYKPFIDKFMAAPNKLDLNYDLRFLYGLRKRILLEGNGPRTLEIKDNKIYIPCYFSDDLNVVDLATNKKVSSTQLQPGRIESDIHRGEIYFNDAEYCFQNWQSCNGCHPGDGRADGLNWDLMNDGVGNSKNCKSMLYSIVTPPSMISGIRAMAEIAVRKGFNLIQFSDIPEERAVCVDKYLESLRPVASPHLVDGELSEAAKQGQKIFQKLECGSCHSGPYFTDMQMYRIGEDVEFEAGWDTPTLIEVWRTAPYLFDGRAATMEDVFKVHKHGVNIEVTDLEVSQLAAYVNSL